MERALPEGPRGRLLALAITVVLLVSLWLGCIQPLFDMYFARADELDHRRVLLQHMAAVAATLPDLQQQPTSELPSRFVLLEGGSDAIAGATLQSTVQGLANRAGISLNSVETLPAEQRGSYRRIGLRLSLSAPWPALIELLRLIEQEPTSMLTDDMQLRAPPLQIRSAAASVNASFTVFSFRSAPSEKKDAANARVTER